MIPIKSIREEFGLAERITPNVFRAELETRSAILHYYFRTVRGQSPDLLTTCRGANYDRFAVKFLESLAVRLTEGEKPPGKLALNLDNEFGFDAAMILTPEYHGHLKGILDDKRENLVYCIPIHECEFAGNETPREYREWQVRVAVENWSRKSVPFVAIGFENPGSPSGSTLVRISLDACMAELEAMNDKPEAHVEISNAWTQRVGIFACGDQKYVVSRENRKLECTFDALASFVESFAMIDESRPGLR